MLIYVSVFARGVRIIFLSFFLCIYEINNILDFVSFWVYHVVVKWAGTPVAGVGFTGTLVSATPKRGDHRFGSVAMLTDTNERFSVHRM